MAPAYKLTYFDVKGAGESIRLLFTYGGIEFEDNRVNKDDWPKIKANYPFGQLPVLEYNGQMANQSQSISRFVGKLVKLGGKNDWEDLEIDAAVDTWKDAAAKVRPLYFEQDEAKKAQLKETLLKETLPFYYEKFDAMVKKNNGYLAVGRLTWADITFVSALSSFQDKLGVDPIANYPNLVALRNTVNAIPSIKAWNDKHKDSK